MMLSLFKKTGGYERPSYLVVNGKRVFYIVPAKPPTTDTERVEEYNANFGVFEKYTIVEANLLKLLEPGCVEASWLDLLVVLGVSKEELEQNLTLMQSKEETDDPSI